eukprot:1151742-Pelagomonas_calceolata.AAC.4
MLHSLTSKIFTCPGWKASIPSEMLHSLTSKIFTCPGWKASNAPSMYTMRAPSGATRLLENCTRRREVGRKRERVVCWTSRGTTSPSPARCYAGKRVVSMHARVCTTRRDT